MARTGKPAVRLVEAVERAAAVLEVLSEHGPELGTNEIARRSGINPSSVSRLLATLVAARLVDFDEDSGRYRLGVRLLQLGTAAALGLGVHEAGTLQLRRLVDVTGETATLSVPGEHEAITVDFVQSAASVQSVARIGRPSVAHATAAGKVLLAFGDVAPPAGTLRRYTSRTIVSRTALAAEVARVRERGWAKAVREREEDLSAIAAPVLDVRGELVAIVGVQGPATRLRGRPLSAAVPPLLAATQSLSGR